MGRNQDAYQVFWDYPYRLRYFITRSINVFRLAAVSIASKPKPR
jgi:hypothetical protein